MGAPVLTAVRVRRGFGIHLNDMQICGFTWPTAIVQVNESGVTADGGRLDKAYALRAASFPPTSWRVGGGLVWSTSWDEILLVEVAPSVVRIHRDDQYSLGMFVRRRVSARIRTLAMSHNVKVVVRRRREIARPWFMRLSQRNPFE